MSFTVIIISLRFFLLAIQQTSHIQPPNVKYINLKHFIHDPKETTSFGTHKNCLPYSFSRILRFFSPRIPLLWRLPSILLLHSTFSFELRKHIYFIWFVKFVGVQANVHCIHHFYLTLIYNWIGENIQETTLTYTLKRNADIVHGITRSTNSNQIWKSISD